jgi:hypothetical protein
VEDVVLVALVVLCVVPVARVVEVVPAVLLVVEVADVLLVLEVVLVVRAVSRHIVSRFVVPVVEVVVSPGVSAGSTSFLEKPRTAIDKAMHAAIKSVCFMAWWIRSH